MEKRVEQLLRRVGVYAPMKSTTIYETYLRTLRRDVFEARNREIEFYRRTLAAAGNHGAIFDVGANLGDKAEVFRRVPAKVFCFEPDRTNIKFLRQRFRKRDDVFVVGKALNDSAGMLKFNIFQDGDALNTASTKWVDVLTREEDTRFGMAKKVATTYEVEAVTLDYVLEQYGPALYVKIDVEGLEVNVLRGLTKRVPFISFEANLPEFRAESLECVSRLASISPDVKFNYDIDNQMEMPEWMNAEAFSAWLSNVDKPYMEVWAKNL